MWLIRYLRAETCPTITTSSFLCLHSSFFLSLSLSSLWPTNTLYLKKALVYKQYRQKTLVKYHMKSFSLYRCSVFHVCSLLLLSTLSLNIQVVVNLLFESLNTSSAYSKCYKHFFHHNSYRFSYINSNSIETFQQVLTSTKHLLKDVLYADRWLSFSDSRNYVH